MLAVCLLGIGFWGCVNLGEGTQNKSRFYVLRPLTAEQVSAEGQVDGVKIGIGPVRIPEYLGQPQIVTRTGSSRLQVNEFHRWAEPLDENFLRALRGNLSILLSTNQIYQHPWVGSTHLDYQVAVDVLRFDGNLGGNVTLNAVWTVYTEDRKEVLLRKRQEYQQPVDGDSYEALVAAHRESLSALSRDIAAALKEIIGKRS